MDCRILADIEESEGVRAGGEASLEAQPAIQTAAIIDSLLERARDLPTMGEQVRQQLEYARGLAQRQLRKRRSTSAEVDACVKRFCDKQGEQHAEMGRAMQRLHDLSKKHDAAKESALAAKEELQKIKAEAAEQKRKEKEEQQALEELKYFDAKMCGFGLEYGGNQSFQKVRFDFIERVKSKFPPYRFTWSKIGYHFAIGGISSKVGIWVPTEEVTAIISSWRWRGCSKPGRKVK